MYKIGITFKVQEEGRETEVSHPPSEPCDFVPGSSGYQVESKESGIGGEEQNLTYAVLDYLKEWLKKTKLLEDGVKSRSGKVKVYFKVEEIAHKGHGPEDKEFSKQLDFVASSSQENYKLTHESNGFVIVGRGKSLPLAVLKFLRKYFAQS